jgi:hypothetical protein
MPKSAMIVHFGGDPNRAWASIIHLLVSTAQRLFPTFMLALSEEHERAHWAAAVVHEMKTDALLMREDLVKAQKLFSEGQISALQGVWPRVLDQADSMVNLSQDFLSTLDERYETPDVHAMDPATIDPYEQLCHALAPWRARFSWINTITPTGMGCHWSM